ncbi:hypothetical protein C8R43DRAFT_901879 [Mycena crocata]|nr:hypothetical protein C8R43DRAFT_901879 [Mycena crocata]
MVNWSDTAEILKDSDAFVKIIFAFFGVHIWELFMTFGFEWSLITGRRRFRWPLLIYSSELPDLTTCWRRLTPLQYSSSSPDTACSSPLLDCASSICSSGSTTINCGALFTFNSWTGNMAILCASTSLMLRTIALWERKRSVVIPLGLLSLAHWVLLYRTMFVVKAVWDHNLRTCVVASTNSSLLNVTFFFTMGFDFVILSTTAVALWARHSARTDLWKLLFTDGLVYFVVTFSMNCVPAVLNLLNLNCRLLVQSPDLRAKSSRSIAACRAVMRLLDYNSDVYVHSMAAIMPSSERHSNAPFSLPGVPKYTLTRPEGVLVTTEHITMSEFS